MPKVKGTIRSESCPSNNSKTTEVNLTKLHRKMEHYETVCPAQKLDSSAQGQGHNQVNIQNNSKTTEGNLTKLRRKIEHDEMVCPAQECQCHNQARGQIVPKILFSLTSEAKI